MDPDVGVRRGVISALVRLGELNLHELVSALDDSGTARRAIELSAHNFVGTMSVDARLAAFASGDDDDLAELAVWALGERWQEQGERSECAEVLDVVEHATRHHRDALVREAAVAALGSIGAQRSIPVIIAAGSDKATVRRRAVIALAPFDGPDVDAALRGALNDRDWQVRQAAEDLTVPPPS